MITDGRPREECGIFAIYGHEDTARLIYFGLYALQHRGQESSGISVGDGHLMLHHKGMGLVSEIFNESTLAGLRGHLGVGHVRYSTTGSSILVNAQPFCITHSGCSLAVAHNGNLVNAHRIKSQLEQQGSIFQTTMDSEVASSVPKIINEDLCFIAGQLVYFRKNDNLCGCSIELIQLFRAND